MPDALAFVLRPLSPTEFRAKFYGKQSIRISDSSSKFRDLFSWAALNDILNSAPIPHPTMKLVLEGRALAASDGPSVLRRCREGATLILEDIDKYDPRVAHLSSTLSSELGEPTKTNVYLSQPSRPGFNRHYDTHDVFILQIAGFKGWRVFEDTVKYPLFVQKFHGVEPPSTPVLECTLEAGDVLYIPRGHWHEATAQAEESLHLTLGLYSRTGIDFLLWLADELREDVRWREAAPLVFSDELRSGTLLNSDTIAYFDRLKASLTEKISVPELPFEYRRFCVAQGKKTRPFSFPLHPPNTSIDARTQFHRPAHQRAMIDVTSDEVAVTVWGQIFTFGRRFENLVRQIFSSTSFSGEELLHPDLALRWDDVLPVLEALFQEGVIERDRGVHTT